MVYGRRRRYRKSSKLTSAKIFLHRGAKAQARQIARLNRRVSAISRANRPEVLTRWVTLDRTFTNGSLASNYEFYWWNPWSSQYGGNRDYGDSLQGNVCINKGITCKFNVEYSDSWSGHIAQSENHQRTASYRIVIMQLKSSVRDSGLTSSEFFSQIFNASSTLTSNDANVIMPLKSGVKSWYKILYSKAFGISNEHPIRLHNIHIPSKRCINYSLETSNTGNLNTPTTCKGTVLIGLLTGGLHSDADYTSQINMSTMLKLAFTDA